MALPAPPAPTLAPPLAPPPAPPAPRPAGRSFGWLGLDPSGWRGTLALAGALILLVAGTQAINAAVSETPSVDDPGTLGAGISVNGRVTVHPPAGWTVGGRFDTMPGVRLQRGDVVIDVRTTTSTEQPGKFLAGYIRSIILPDTTQFDITSTNTTTVARQYRAVRATYLGLFKGIASPIEGQLTGLVFNDGLAIVFDAWAPQGSLTGALDDIQQILDTVEIGS